MNNHNMAYSNNITSPTGMSGLASRRGGQAMKPLSVDTLKSAIEGQDNGPATPRTSRSHLLAGLRTAPKTATATTFASASMGHARGGNRSSMQHNVYSPVDNLYNGPKTSMPRYGSGHQQAYSAGGYEASAQHFAADQILAPPELQMETMQSPNGQHDAGVYAALVQQNLQLAQQRQILEQQLANLSQAQQQLGNMNLTGQQQMFGTQQALLQQQQLQQQIQQQQMQMQMQAAAMQPMMQPTGQPNVYTYIDPTTGQQAYYIDQNHNQYDIMQAYQQQQSVSPPPRVQVSPPIEQAGLRNMSPPRRNDYFNSNDNVTPLPPPSANAFRRGHKKSSSLMLNTATTLQAAHASDAPKSAGPKTANFPMTPTVGGYQPGHGRAGEHPIRQPRGPPSLDELKAKPTAKHEGSKNFATRTRRSALSNLMRAGLERRKGSSSSSPRSFTPISEISEEDARVAIADAESDSGRSGSGSLNGEEEVEGSLPSSRTSTGSWGAIGSNRPISRQMSRESNLNGDADGDDATKENSFASMFKSKLAIGSDATAPFDGPRKATMMVLGGAEKRRNGMA